MLFRSTPPFEERYSAPSDDDQSTRTLSGGAVFAVLARIGYSSSVKRNGATLLVPNCKSRPYFVFTATSRGHDVGIVPDSIEAVIFAEEGLSGALNGCEIIEVNMQENEQASKFGETRFNL